MFTCPKTLVYYCSLCPDPDNLLDTDRTFLRETQLLRHARAAHSLKDEEYKAKFPDFAKTRPAYK